MEGLYAADIICATPEKFDAVTRSGMHFFSDIGLVFIGGCCWVLGCWVMVSWGVVCWAGRCCGGCWAA
jgi:hypothetical protein